MPETPTRRTFLFAATAGMCLVGLGAGAAGLFRAIAPGADVAMRTTGFKVKLSDIEEGTELRVKAYGLPIFIRHRTAEEIAAAEAVDLTELPVNQTIDVLGRPLGTADDQIRRATPDGRFIALLGVGSGFGCVSLGEGAGDYTGWFDPCRGTHYDTSGRIRKGPATENLRLPSYQLIDGDTLWFTDPKTMPKTTLDDLLYR